MYSMIRTQYRPLIYAVGVLGMLWWVTTHPQSTRQAAAQSADEAGPSSGGAAPTGENEAAAPPAPIPSSIVDADKSLNILRLALEGGIFMIPLFGLSILSATIVVERFLGLRKAKILPDALVTELGQLGGTKGGFDPRAAYRICQQYPSTAARVVRAMLLKVGRPLSEVEHTVKEASEREATKLYTNVRWLTLAASMSTLIGLLGTVQGMILAFHQLTMADPRANKAQILAGGIYVALVTTFTGLCIAIPAGSFAHYFEGRILALFHEIDELVFSLLPQVERYEGRVRFSRQMEDGEAPVAAAPPAAAPPPPAPAGANS